LFCDHLENLSEDSDEERDTKYNILDETNEIIEEEDEGADEDENEDEGDYNPDIITFTPDQKQEVEKFFK